jgi:glycosyltransferase involved in cell wall biosynthesis
MKVLHIITGLNDGGAEGALFRLCKNDGINSHCIVSLLSGGKYESKFKAINISTYSLNLNTTLGVLKCLTNYKTILNKFQPDIIQTWLYHADFFGGICSYILGYKRILWNIRNCNTSNRALKPSTRIIIFINSVLSHFIPIGIISVSQSATLHHIGIGYNKNKFINIPNGYDFDELCPKSKDLIELKKQSNFLIGMVARYDPQKDHNNLLASLVILRDSGISFNCILVGTGMDEQNKLLVRHIEKLKLDKHVKLLGIRDDICSIMKILDLHVLSSLGEAFPNVLVEAMSNGTVCVSTNVGDASLIINGLGWLVEPENSVELANAITKANELFLNRKLDWDLLCINAKDSVINRFSVESMVNSYVEVWSDLYTKK